MKNTNLILTLDFVQEKLSLLKKSEDERLYCRHDLHHFFDVARICYILCLENRLEISKDVIYATAILHDLGREDQIHEGIPHEKASVSFAERCLAFTDFSEEEKRQILDAISHHRKKTDDLDFSALFYQADRLSRDCFNCKVYDSCYWGEEKKNRIVRY